MSVLLVSNFRERHINNDVWSLAADVLLRRAEMFEKGNNRFDADEEIFYSVMFVG